MKRKIITLLLLMFSITAFAQEGSAKKDNLLFLVRNKEHVSQAIKTIADLQTCRESSVHPDKAVIIVCGEAVKSLAEPEALQWLSHLHGLEGVSILACGLSLEKFSVPPAKLVPGIGLVKNGLVKAFELQQQGYLSIEL